MKREMPEGSGPIVWSAVFALIWLALIAWWLLR